MLMTFCRAHDLTDHKEIKKVSIIHKNSNDIFHNIEYKK